MKTLRLLLMVGVLLLLALALPACGGGQQPAVEEGAPTETGGETAGQEEARPTIILVENPWPASELNVRVAREILQNELNYPVEIIALDENVQWDALASGDADASLEVWPSGHGERIVQYIEEQGVVENGGRLGPEGIIGWFVPTYVVEEHPELASWEGYANADLAALFATAETGEKGQFLAGDPSWVQYDADIIKNLGMNLQVVTAGSEDALLAAVSSAYSRQEPVLFYFYQPHAVFSQFDLTQVELPVYSDECYANAEGGSVACAYPTDELMKIFSAKLAEKAPEAHQFLANMNYDNAAQIAMLAMLDEGMSTDEAAAKWVEDNRTVWGGWLP